MKIVKINAIVVVKNREILYFSFVCGLDTNK